MRTLETREYLNSVTQAGCTLRCVLEPQLEKEIAERYHAERYEAVPGYLCDKGRSLTDVREYSH